MKRLRRDPLRYDAFDLFAAYGGETQSSLRDPAQVEAFVHRLKENVENSVRSPTFMYGQRAQALFEVVAARLGKCRLVRREDVGPVFHNQGRDLQPPDYRVVLEDGRQLLVEVKNCHQGGNPRKPQKEKAAYLDSLIAYAETVGCELRMATFWSKWKRWTLVPLTAFRRDGESARLAFEDANLHNEMSEIGDFLVGTRSPLRFRVVADQTKPRAMEPNGHVTFTIARCELLSEDRRLVDPVDLKIGTFLTLFGGWDTIDSPVEIVDGQLVAVEHQIGPDPEFAHQEEKGFDIINAISSMISHQYLSETTRDDLVDRVHSAFTPGDIVKMFPDEHRSSALPLWIFRVAVKG